MEIFMFIRICEDCKTELTYKRKQAFMLAEKNKSVCKKCAAKRYRKSKYDIHSKVIDGKTYYIRDCPSCKKELKQVNYRKYWDALKFNKKCKSCASKARYKLHTLSNCEFVHGKRKFFRICKTCKGKVYYTSPEQASRFRDSSCKKCAPPSYKPNYNPYACQIIDEYGKQHGYNFQHALNGGEFNVPNTPFFVDGYDAIHNVVIEFDERHHKYQKKQDKFREKEIIKQLNCHFIRLSLDECEHSSTT